MKRITKLGLAIVAHLVKIGVLILYFLFSYQWQHKLVGLINKRWPEEKRPIRSVFLVYAVNKYYQRRFLYTWFARWCKKEEWKIIPVDLFFQNKRFILVFCITAFESEFEPGSKNYRNGIAREKLASVEERFGLLRQNIGAPRKTKAGILPSIETKLGVSNSLEEQETTVIAVMKAIDKTMELENLTASETNIVVIGSRGFVGQELMRLIPQKGFQGFEAIDIDTMGKFRDEISVDLKGEPTIILNLTKRGALKQYLPYIWPESVVLNEVYPEPSRQEVAMVVAAGAKIYHIVGPDGWVLFPLGGGYHNKIPCCAAFPPEDLKDFKIVVSRMELNERNRIKWTLY